MTKKRRKRKKSTIQDTQIQTQAGILIDRLAAQDPNGETLGHFLESLKETLAANKELATAFVEELGKLKLEIAGDVFREIEKLFDEKKYRKAAKRTRFRLVQKGILKEEKQEKGDSTSVRYIVTSADKPLSLCYFAVLEPIGEEMVLVYIPGGADRDTIVQFVLNQTRELGLLVFEKSYYKRSMAKDLVRHLEDSYRTNFFEIPLSYAAYLFNEGVATGVVEGEAKVREAEREMKKYLEIDAFPLIYNYINKAEIEVSQESIAVATRFLGEENFPLKVMPAENSILPSEKLTNVFESTLIVNPSTRKEQMEDIINKAIIEYFSGQTLHGFIRCLEELALYLYMRDEKEKCMCLLSVVRDLKENPENISHNAFLKKLFTRTAAIVLRDVLTDEDFKFYFEDSFDEFQKTAEEEEREDGLIIVPK